ncbi:MAG: PIG-L family deacetylase [Clostridiales bacterium]|jgi:LmbE family N-acetylglucosaminyl deacetylase|nr:PIG-L family deacetylase [Clostridiales bacterium]
MIKLSKKDAEIYVPDGGEAQDALAKTTRLAISAHQDDIEFMAYSAIAECFRKPNKGFSAVVMTDGAGSPRAGVYADCTDADMIKIRKREQKTAADIGGYKSLALLGYPSAELKDRKNAAPQADLTAILRAAAPEFVYTHNLADKHDTHVAVAARVLDAIRSLPKSERPKKVFGCEVWRSLDWLDDAQKVMLDCADRLNLAAALMGVFDSQISGGKRYDTAVFGRRSANATFSASHGVDDYTQVAYAMDLTPLIENDGLSYADFAAAHIDAFRSDVINRLNKFKG